MSAEVAVHILCRRMFA